VNAIEKAVKARQLTFKQLHRSWTRVKRYKARLHR
jgi:hypothetical protein